MISSLSIKEFARFFDVSTSAIRVWEREVLHQESFRISATERHAGFRRYTFADIRDMAVALQEHEILNEDQVQVVLNRVSAFEVPVKKKNKQPLDRSWIK